MGRLLSPTDSVLCSADEQPLFELGHDPLAEPMRIIRAFFMPLIREAEMRAGALKDGKVRLIDRLVEATERGEPITPSVSPSSFAGLCRL